MLRKHTDELFRQERKNRAAFKKLLEDLVEQGKINAESLWRIVYPDIAEVGWTCHSMSYHGCRACCHAPRGCNVADNTWSRADGGVQADGGPARRVSRHCLLAGSADICAGTSPLDHFKLKVDDLQESLYKDKKLVKEIFKVGQTELS